MKQNESKKPLCTLSGKVIYGKGIGKLVGMPTANLEMSPENALPPAGVYVTEIALDGSVYYGVTNVGACPTVTDDENISVETHILNFNMEIYEKEMKIQLFDRLRSQQKFENFSMLLNQIRTDCTAARDFFGIAPSSSRLHMDIEKHLAAVDGREVYLSAKEFDVLYMLYSNPDVTFTKDQIYESIWHEPSNGYCHAVENTVFQIRKRLRPYAAGYDFIKTVIGYGYRFRR